MKLSRLSILAVAALSCAAFAISCESDDNSALAPFWADGSAVDGDALKGGNGNGLNGDGFGDLNGGDAGLRGGDGFGDGGLNGGDGFDSNSGPGAYGEDMNNAPYIDGFGAKIEGVEFQPLYFPYDQNTISSSEESKVAAVAQYLLGHSEAGVVVEGYCDERGTEEYNRALGERRALAASEMLIDIYGIESSRVKTVSYGEERPAVTGTGDAVWSKNRRDEFVPVYLKNN
jgi:peptidoglycan-associated lipoprotein